MARLFWVILILTSSSAWAQQKTEPESESAYVKESYQTISEQVSDLSDRIDSLFGDQRTDDEASESTMRIEQSYFWRDNENGSYDIQLNLNLKLKNLKLREQAIREAIQRQKEYEAEVDHVDGKGPIRPRKEKTWEFVQDSGVRFSLPIGYYAHGRVRRTKKYLGFTNYFYQQVGWDSRDQWLSTTSLTSDFPLSDRWIFRLGNGLGWGMTSKTFGSSHSASVLSELNKNSGLSVDLRYFTVLNGRAIYQDFYSFGATYRYAFSNGWTFLEVTPDILWRSQDSFAGKTGILIKVEALFGGDRNNI